jgi:hypothetical protein
LIAFAVLSAGCASTDVGEASGASRRADELVARAWNESQERHPGCQPGSGASRPTLEHVADAPPAWLTDRLAVLRRRQTAEEAAFSAEITDVSSPFFPLVGDRLYAEATRLVDFGDGARLAITVAQTARNSTAYAVPYDTCTRIRRRILSGLLRKQPAAVRRRARALEAEQARDGRPGPTPYDTTIGVARVDGRSIRAGGPTTASWFDDTGAWVAWPVEDGTAVIGIVPDGVAGVHLRSNRRGLKVVVHDNLFLALVPRPIDRAFPDRITWTSATGVAINTITPDPLYSDFARP